MRDDDPEMTVDIDEVGEVRATTRAAQRRLSAAAGRWKLFPQTGDVIVLQRDGATGGVAMCGEIDAPGALTNVFNFVHLSQWTGMLSVISGPSRRNMAFSAGQLLGASSNLPESRLGAVLVRLGMLREGDLAAAAKEVTPARRLGAVLVEQGVLTPQQLYEAVQHQVEEVFYAALLLRRGSWTFIKRLDDAAIATRLHLDTQTLLLEGLRRIDELSYFRGVIPTAETVLVRRPLAVGEELPPFADGDAATLYRALELPRSVAEASRLLHLGEFEATRAAFTLVQTGHVQVREAASLRRHKPTTIPPFLPDDADLVIIDAYNTAFARLDQTLAAQGQQANFRHAVHGFLDDGGRWKDLFRDVHIVADGTLPKRQLLANVDGMPDKTRLELLQQGLSDLLFFMLFVAGDAIGRAEEVALHESVIRALSKLPRG